MLGPGRCFVFAFLLFALPAIAKDKKKNLLPVDVLQAHTVLVVVDPNAGVDVQDPMANRTARLDVEQAFIKWGRLTPVTDGYTADLVVTVRKGNGKTVEPTIGGTPINGTPAGSIGSTTSPGGSSTGGAGRWGQSGIPNDPSNAGSSPSNPHPQMEIGESQDTFVVYRGGKADSNSSPLDAPPVWRYTARDGLEAPDVPAVERFRKLIAESEKQLAGAP